jgi:hypothetical protein
MDYYGSIWAMKRPILRYAQAPDQLVSLKGYGNHVYDAWGRPILERRSMRPKHAIPLAALDPMLSR